MALDELTERLTIPFGVAFSEAQIKDLFRWMPTNLEGFRANYTHEVDNQFSSEFIGINDSRLSGTIAAEIGNPDSRRAVSLPFQSFRGEYDNKDSFSGIRLSISPIYSMKNSSEEYVANCIALADSLRKEIGNYVSHELGVSVATKGRTSLEIAA